MGHHIIAECAELGNTRRLYQDSHRQRRCREGWTAGERHKEGNQADIREMVRASLCRLEKYFAVRIPFLTLVYPHHVEWRQRVLVATCVGHL
jgi:hypothetical protein